MTRRMVTAAIMLAVAVAAPVFLWWLLTNPVPFASRPVPAPRADAARLEVDVRWLAGAASGRVAHDPGALDAAAVWIGESFRTAGCTPAEQTFEVGGRIYRNVVCSLGPRDAPRLVIGAHYDVLQSPGADDNASGVAALLELARMIQAARPALPHRLDLVAFTLEEPPHFKTATMGSHVYARRLREDGARLKLAVSVEMIGFYSDAPGSQQYPVGALRWLYPDRGDFIGVVGRTFDRSAVARVKDLMRVDDAMPVYSINAPTALPGVDFSDQWSFWQHGQPAVMVTDTAFLRNPHYHSTADTADTLDYRRMALVVDGLYQVALRY